MLEYQERYISNIKRINELKDIYAYSDASFEKWYENQLQAKKEMKALKQDNIAILNEKLFPVLDDLFNADEETIKSLEAFADQLMDWRTNLDPGVYILIHDSLLKIYRLKAQRNKVIKELYKLGMGHYYRNRMIQGSEHALSRKIFFENEMIFTEAGSYIRYFDKIEDEETKGYIIRALANISIATTDRKRRISTTARVLNIVSDPYYRQMAPNLPWDTFLRRTYQQMSSNRATLSKGDLSNEELALVMEACQIIFEPEKDNDTPNIRWLWPYYEMEYSCGFADLKTTLQRMEKLIDEAPTDQYDESGLYGNAQLPIYYGRLLKSNPQLLDKPRYQQFLKHAYDKMLNYLLSYPNEKIDEFYFYDITLLVYSYLEHDCVDSFYDVTRRLMGRIFGSDYVTYRKAGEIISLLCETIYRNEKDYFDDITFLKAIEDEDQKKEALLQYASSCGMFYNFGLVSMNMSRITNNRNLFDSESEIYSLHCELGYDTLITRNSTKIFADIALGHHAYYDENGGYPQSYVRYESEYRRMSDIVAIADRFIIDNTGDINELASRIKAKAGTIYSPLVCSYLDQDLIKKIETILKDESREYYRELFELITMNQSKGF